LPCDRSARARWTAAVCQSDARAFAPAALVLDAAIHSAQRAARSPPALPFPCGALEGGGVSGVEPLAIDIDISLLRALARAAQPRRPEPFQRNTAGRVKTLLQRGKSHNCRCRCGCRLRARQKRRPFAAASWARAIPLPTTCYMGGHQPTSGPLCTRASPVRCQMLSSVQLPAPFCAHESSHRQACAASFPAARRLWPAMIAVCRRIIVVSGAWCKVPRRPHLHLAALQPPAAVLSHNLIQSPSPAAPDPCKQCAL
jgi:hypothetical protein